MITLYHCDGARSFRPLWMLEELGLAYELKMLPFPPRVLAKDYLAINPLGTIPFLIDGETRMTESSGICHYLGIKHGPTPLMVGPEEKDYGTFLNWMYFSDATLTYGAFFLGLCVLAHLFIRARLPDADPYMFPLAAVLAGARADVHDPVRGPDRVLVVLDD